MMNGKTRHLVQPPRITLSETCRSDTEYGKRGMLSIGFLNARSIMSSLDEVRDLLSANNLDILCVGETWLTPDVSDKFLIFPGYSIIRLDRNRIGRNAARRGGGVCILHRHSVTVEKMSIESTDSDTECLWAQVVSCRPTIVGVVYRPPSAAVSPSLNDLSHQLTQILAKSKPMFLFGDTNFDMLDMRKPGVAAYSQMLQDYNLTQMIGSSTHPGMKPSLLDHLVTNTPELVFDAKVVACDISDHDLITAQVKGTRVRRRPVEITVRATRDLCPDALRLDMLLDDWTPMYAAVDPEEKFGKFLEVWNRNIDKHMPLIRIRARHPPCPWLVNNTELRQKMTERDRAWRLKDRYPNADTRERYKRCRNDVKRAQYSACSSYFKQTFQNRRHTTWANIKRYFMAGKKSKKDGAEPPEGLSQWADKLNDHFASVGPSVASSLSAAATTCEKLTPRPPRVCANTFRVTPATLPEMSAALKRMGTSRACGTDGVTIQMLRMTFPVIGPHLLNVLNCSLSTGQVPKIWKMAIIQPVFKSGDRSDPGNYRPISIVSVIAKLCERIVCTQLEQYLHDNSILYAQQYGFRHNHSTELAMLDAITKITDEIDAGRIATLVTADTSKAFDSVCHDMLLEKLGWYGVDRHWFADWLSDRYQSVRGGSSSSLPVTHGVVQGSVLGPVLFLIFTNDFASHISDGKVIMYADDTQFIDADEPANSDLLKSRIERTLATALSWFTQNSLKINPSKTEFLLFRTRHRRISDMNIQFGVHSLASSSKAKVLGIVIDPALTWEHHISLTVQRCYRVLVGMCKLRNRLPRDLRVLLIETLVFPLIRYCACVWGGACTNQKQRLQKVVHFAARIISNLKRNDHITPTLNQLGWPSIDKMITDSDVSLINRIMGIENPPPAMTDMLRFRSEVTCRDSRSSVAPLLQLPRVRTELKRRSFSYRALQNWNDLTIEHRRHFMGQDIQEI